MLFTLHENKKYWRHSRKRVSIMVTEVKMVLSKFVGFCLVGKMILYFPILWKCRYGSLPTDWSIYGFCRQNLGQQGRGKGGCGITPLPPRPLPRPWQYGVRMGELKGGWVLFIIGCSFSGFHSQRLYTLFFISNTFFFNSSLVLLNFCINWASNVT